MIIAASDRKIWRPEGGIASKGEYESYTSISKYLSCPVNHYKYYIAYGREPVSIPLLLGRAAHETVSSVLLEKLFRGIDLPLETVEETFHFRWALELYLAKTQPGGINWTGPPSPQQVEETGRQLLRHWARDVLPNTTPKAIEEPFQARLKDVEQFLTGRFDLITEAGFIDHKTAGQPYSERMADHYKLQMATYYLGYVDRYKKWPAEVGFTWLTTTGELEAYMVSFTLTKAEVQEAINDTIKPTMQRMAESRKTGLWPCKCGHHKDVDKKRVDADRAAEQKERDRIAKILNPEIRIDASEFAVTAKKTDNGQDSGQTGADSLPF